MERFVNRVYPVHFLLFGKNIEKAVRGRIVDGLSGSVEGMLPQLLVNTYVLFNPKPLTISKYYLAWTGFVSQAVFYRFNQFNGIVRFGNKIHSPGSLGTFAIVASRPG